MSNSKSKPRKLLPIFLGAAVLVAAVLMLLLYNASQNQNATPIAAEKTVSVVLRSEEDQLDESNSFSTELEFLGDLLVENKLVEYENSAYGRYITAAGGINGGEDNRYWMIYVDGKPAEVGMDGIVLEDGASYSLILEAANMDG